MEEQVVEAGRRGTHLQLFRRPAQGCPPLIEQAAHFVVLEKLSI